MSGLWWSSCESTLVVKLYETKLTHTQTSAHVSGESRVELADDVNAYFLALILSYIYTKC